MFAIRHQLEADERFCSLPGFPLDPAAVARQGSELMLVAEDADRLIARCSLWWSATPVLDGRHAGYIGHFAALDGLAAQGLLKAACAFLSAKGCAQAIGPIDGNTWQRYRLITERGNEPLYFLELDNPDDWPGMFTASGFTPLAQYYSAVNENLPEADPRIPAIAQRLYDLGVIIRPLDVSRFEDELRRVHALSLLSFQNNFLYSPIGEADFLEQYSGIRRFVRPELALLAEKDGELIGFLFAIPDLLRPKYGKPMDTVILKTLAVHPEHGGLGLGSLLMAGAHEAARQLGFTRAIHALFHESNRSGRISGHTARVFRRYTLFARSLEPFA
jgi:GNAT superfamily N-acetyltransferase